MKMLILTDDVTQARQLISQFNIENIFVLDEVMVREGAGVTTDPDTPGYKDWIVTKMSNLVKAFKFKLHVAVIADMRYDRAVELIPHDFSCLLYSGSKKHHLAYNPQYKTTYKIKDLADTSSIQNIQKVIQNIG